MSIPTDFTFTHSHAHKVEASPQVEENIAQKLKEAEQNERLFVTEQDITKLWSDFKNLYSAESLASIHACNDEDSWSRFISRSESEIQQLQGKLALYRQITTLEHQKWHETKRLGNEEWNSAKLFVDKNFGKLEKFLGEFKANLSRFNQDLLIASRSKSEAEWQKAKDNVISSFPKSFGGFEGSWKYVSEMTPERLAEHKQSAVNKISNMYNQYKEKIATTASYDWNSLKNASQEKWDEAKIKFADTMQQAKAGLENVRDQAMQQYHENIEGVPQEQWENLKKETLSSYEAASAKLDQINLAWQERWEGMKQASISEWETISHATSQKLQQVSDAFNDMWNNFSEAAMKTWYNWTEPNPYVRLNDEDTTPQDVLRARDVQGVVGSSSSSSSEIIKGGVNDEDTVPLLGKDEASSQSSYSTQETASLNLRATQ